MAIKDLHCAEGPDYIAVIWSWDEPGAATITVTRLLDGEVLSKTAVSRESYNQARFGNYHGPCIKKVDVPVRVTVESEDGAEKQETELLSRKYIVEWHVEWQQTFQKKLLSRKLVSRQADLVLDFPCEGKVPNDLFYYTLGPQHKEGEKPVGFLPRLKAGRNVYGMLPAAGQPVLYCNPKHTEISRLFDFKHLPDRQLPDREVK